jgi:ATP-dependent exoDNAse (exonuclease V) beta subunit
VGRALARLDDIDVRIEQIASDVVRPGGPRFGTLVHALLADVPLARSGEEVLDRLASAHGRVLGAAAEEIAAAAGIVRRVLRHPLMVDAARASGESRCYRETPVTLRLDSGALIEGNVDLAYHADGHVVVIDFKTDRELEGALDVYRRQVQIYAHAIASATGRPARAVLMKV